MNTQKWVFGFFLGLMGVSAVLFTMSLIENVQDDGPRHITVNAIRGLALIGAQALLYTWLWVRRKRK